MGADTTERDQERWFLRAFDRMLRSCGFREEAERAEPEAEHARLGQIVVILAGRHGERIVMGRLRREGDAYRFDYEPGVMRRSDVQPIPEFPELDRTYRADRLWPFFTSRLPPLKRQDVKATIAARGVSPDDTLELLVELSGGSVASPYVLERTDKETREPEPVGS